MDDIKDGPGEVDSVSQDARALHSIVFALLVKKGACLPRPRLQLYKFGLRRRRLPFAAYETHSRCMFLGIPYLHQGSY